jgi:hypothetical protein
MLLPNVINGTSPEARFATHPAPKCRLVGGVEVPEGIAENQSQSHKSKQHQIFHFEIVLLHCEAAR